MYQYVSPKKAAEIFGVTTRTLRNWEKKCKISSVRLKGGHRRFKIKKENKRKQSKNFIYCRVSSRKQLSDLKTQQKTLEKKYPTYEVVKDIGSGLNFKRKGFRKILEQLIEGNIGEVVVAFEDRFTRFGFDFFKFLFEKHGAKLISLQTEKNKSFEEEFSDDIISIITHFTAKYHGARKYNKIFKEDSNISDEESD